MFRLNPTMGSKRSEHTQTGKVYVNKTILCFLMLAMSAGVTQAELGEEKRKAVTELFKVIGVDRQLSGGFEAMLPTVTGMADNMNLNEAQTQELIGIYRTWFENDIDRESMKAEIEKIYAEAFTVEEMKELLRFYKTPVGQKFLEISPDLMKRGAEVGMKEAEKKQGVLMERLQPFFQKIQQP